MTGQVYIRFYAELNELLPSCRRNSGFSYPIKKSRSVKDLIEAIGVPHTEVDLVFVNDLPVDFDYLVTGDEQIDVYPPNSDAHKSASIHNQPDPPAEPRFLLDVHLGRLAGYLRMLGIDTLYRNDYDDPTLADTSAAQNRILLTCDRKLLMRKKIKYGYLVRSRHPPEQVREVLQRYQLFDYRSKVARCLDCNGIIQSVSKAGVEDRLLPLTRQHYDDFYQCNSCHKIYWEGSHFKNIQQSIKDLKSGRNGVSR